VCGIGNDNKNFRVKKTKRTNNLNAVGRD